MSAAWSFESVFRQSVAGFAILDLHGRWLELNDAAARLLGAPRETLLGTTPTAACPATDVAALADRLARTRDGSLAGFRFDFSLDRPDGGTAWLRLRASVVGGGGGAPGYLAASLDDISAERAPEDARYAFFELSADPLAISSPDGYILRVNPAWQAMLGWSSEDMRCRPFLEFVHPDDRERTAAEAASAHEGTSTSQFRNRYRTRDGRYRWLEWRTRRDPVDGQLYSVARDVTEQQQALVLFEAELERRRAALDSAEQRLSAHVNHSPLAVIEFDAGFRVRRWSKQAEAIFGWSEEEVLGDRPDQFRFIHDDDVDYVAIQAQGLMTGDVPSSSVRNRNYTRDGGVVHCEWFNSAVFDARGQLLSILSFAQDVTARVEAEQAVEEREALFRATFEQAPVGIAHIGLDGRWLRVNRTLCDFLGYQADALMQLGFQDITHPDDLDDDLSHVADLLAGRIERYEMRKRYLHCDGDVRWAQLTVSLRHDEAGAPLHFISVIEDIAATRAIESALQSARDGLERRVAERTRELEGANRTLAMEVEQRREAEAALRESELRMRSILENSHDAFVATGDDGRIVEWNRAAEAIFGWRRSEVVGKSLTDVIVPPALRAAHERGMARFVASGESRVLDQRLQLPAMHRSGHEFPVELTISRVRFGRRSLFTAFLHDVSERVSAERQLRESERRLKTITDNAPAIITYIDRQHRFQFVNATFCEWHGLRPEEVVGRTIAEVRGEAVQARMRPLLERAGAGERAEADSIVEHFALGARQCHITCLPDVADDGSVKGIHVMAYDVTVHKTLAQMMERRAMHDELTGLPNRAGLAIALDDALAGAAAHGSSTAVLFLDLDGFKQVNDALGHDAGDAVLREFAGRLRDLVGADDTVARLAGDEFVVVLAQRDDAAGAARGVADALQRAMHADFRFGAHSLRLASSIGIAVQAAGSEVDRDALLRRADAAMYAAKRAGAGGHAIAEA